MDSADDDFGELYVDDKVHPSAAFAGEEPECAPIPGENKGFEVTVDPESRGEAKKLDVVIVDKDSSPCVDDDCAVNRTEAKEESEYSDSDDDLNIVLKEDDDSKSLPVACGSNANNRNRSSGNWCTMPNSAMVNGRMPVEAMNPSLGMPQCGYNFSHTWSRTTFDADFSMFGNTPWRNPGVDVNDFFNFGFNEQSWKDYCNPGLKGRAIEVEGGTHGRTPSMDLRQQRDLDPDVVIQIPVTDDVEETPVEARSLSKTSNKASRSEEFHSDIGKDLHSSGDSIKQEVSVGHEDENSGSFKDEQSPPKENCLSREVTPCDKEIIEEEKQETCWSSDKADSSSVERETSLRDHFRCSPTSSYSVGETEESEDSGTESSKGGATDDRREASTPPRRTRFAEHEANSSKSVERSDTEHPRRRRSHADSRERHYGRVDYGVHRRTNNASFKDASRTPDPYFGKQVCSGHGISYRDSSKNWQTRRHFTLEKAETEVRGFPHSNREKRHGRSYSPMDLDRDRGQRLGWRNNKEPSHSRGFDPSNGYKYEEGRKEYTSGSSFNLNQRNSRLSFNKEEGRYGRQHCERRYGRERSPALVYESNKEDRYGRQHCERKYSRERSPGLAYENNKERNRYDGVGEPYYQDRIPITDMEYRYHFEYSFVNGRHNPNQSRENDLHFRRRCDYDYDFPRGKYEDAVHRAESGIPIDLAYREMHSFGEGGRREFERYGEGFSEIDRRHHYTPGWHHDRFVSETDGHKYRIQNAWPSPSLPFRDSWQTKGSRGDSWRDDDFTTREAYDRQNNQLYKDAPRDGWTRNLVQSDNVSIRDRLRYDDGDWVRRDRRRYQLGDDIQCSKHPSYTDEMSLPANTKVSTHDRIAIKQRPGYFKSHIHEADESHPRSKKQRRDGHAFIKCQDPVDVAGRQGKVSNQSRRFPKGGDTRDQQNRQKPRNVMGKRNEKVVVQIQGLNEKEEGEIIQEERNVTRIVIDEEQIQESIKKMEKRRERFKETALVIAKSLSQTEQEAKTDVTNQMRPVRKRRWCAS